MERRRYEGETVDNTLSTVLVGWDTSRYSEAGKGWLPAVEYEALAGRELTPSLLEPITRVEETHPVSFTSHGSGKFSWAFSQNFGGFAELNVPARGFTNTTLTVQVGEERDPSGWPTNGHGWGTGDGHLSWKLRGTEKLEILRPTFMFTGLQFIGKHRSSTVCSVEVSKQSPRSTDKNPSPTDKIGPRAHFGQACRAGQRRCHRRPSTACEVIPLPRCQAGIRSAS